MYQNSKGGSLYIPLEIDGRLINERSPKFAKQVSSKYGNLSERKVQKDLADNHGRKISRTYIQNTTKAVNQVIVEQEQKWTYSLPQQALEATTLGIGLDGTMSHIVNQGYREVMSGTIGFFNEEGHRVHTIYVAQAPEYGKKTFKERFSKEIAAVKTGELLEDMESFRTRKTSKTKKENLETSITYFSNHQHQMNYAQAAEQSLPIGSGITEAACKVIVKVKERLCT